MPQSTEVNKQKKRQEEAVQKAMQVGRVALGLK